MLTVERGPIHMIKDRLFFGVSEKHHAESPSPQPAFPMVFSHLRGERIGDELGGAPASELDIMMH